MLAGAGIPQGRLQISLELADLQQTDTAARPAEHLAEGHGIAAEFLGQGFIDAAEGPVHRRDQPRAHARG
ncbi:MAG: hypothetical protein ACK559_11415, partial [bacterium]